MISNTGTVRKVGAKKYYLFNSVPKQPLILGGSGSPKSRADCSAGQVCSAPAQGVL